MLARVGISSEVSIGEEVTSRLTYMVVSQHHWQGERRWTERLSSCLDVSQRLPSTLCHIGLSNLASCFTKASKE